jgi:hypothetical protein
MVQMLDPTAPTPVLDLPTARGSGNLSGQAVALLDNGWTSLDITFGRMKGMLKDRYGVAKVLHEDIPLGGAAPLEKLRAVAEQVDYAIVGLAN